MQTITVDMTPGFRQPTIHYSQNDVGTTFAIDLRSRFGDTLPASPTVKIQATKPSGFGFSIEADSVADSVATFTTVATMTDEAGRFQAELEVSSGGVVLYTANFYMEGEANPHPIGTTDGSQETVIPTLTLLVERVEAAASSVLDMTVNATTLAAGSQATYSYDEATNTATFGIPQGEAGAGAAGVTASAYSASRTYAVDDYVIHNNNLYRCTTAITTAEAFTAAHWTQVVLGDDVCDLKSAINHIDDGDAVLSIVRGEYFNNSGVITSNPAMGRTGYLDCDGLLELHINSPVSATYNCFFESDLTFISRFTLAVGDNTITVPEDAVYYGISCTVADVDGMEVESKSTMAINKAIKGLGLLEQGLVNFDVIKGSIIYPNGTFTPVVGWSRTDYIDCSAYDEIIMSTTNASSYNGFFDSSKNFISGSPFSVVVGENHISIPDTASYVMFSNTDAAIANTKVFTANSSDIVVLKEDMKAISPSLDLTSNFPILPSQLFFRDDAPVPVFKRSLFQNPARATNADVGLIYEDANGYKRVIDISEPTNIGGIGGEPINGGNGRIYLSNTEDASKLYYKDIDILLKDVSELNGKSVSIMSLGDSLTQGASWDGTPVTALSDELAKLGVTTTFVGSLGKKILKVNIGKQLVMFEGRGGWRYRTLTGRESKYSGVNVIIPSSQTQSAFIEDTDGTYDQCKQNNTFLYPATADDLANYPDFCYHFVSGNTVNNKSYTEDSSLGDYVIFDPTRYFSQRQITIPDIVTIAFGTNEWYLTGYDLQEALDACQFIIEAFRRASNTMKIVVIPHNSINMRRETAWETMASQLTAGVIKIVDGLIADGDDNLYCCPLYANGSRYLSWKSITATADFGTNNDTQVGTISDDVHCLYETGFASSYIAMQQYTDGLTACVANLID